MAGFNPWRWLREHPEVTLRWATLPHGVRGATDGTTILIDVRLGRVQRNATLCHEGIHVERGVTGEPRIDERGVEDEVARRLVPFGELAAMYEIAMTNDLPVEPHHVAEKFDVPHDVAERAMRLFLRSIGKVA